MPSFSVGFAQIEERLRIVRRRLNLLTLQDALYLSGSLVALAVSLLVALALRGRASFFAVAVWATTGAVAAAALAAALRIRRRWLSRAQVVRFADRQGALDDRLATLLLDPHRTRASRLKDLLLEQILAAAPRWDVDTLVPRRVPRSLFLLAASLAALIATSFYVRPPAAPKSASAMRPPATGAAAEDGVLRPRTDRERGGDATQSGLGAATQMAGIQGGGAGTAPHASSSAALDHAIDDHPGTAPSQPAADDLSAGDREPHDVDASAQSPETAPRGMAEKLQDAIRGALGATEEGGDKPRASGHGRTDRDGTADAHPKSGEHPGTDAAPSSDLDAKSATTQPPAGSANKPGSGSAATAGARTGEAAAELFGGQAGTRQLGSESQNLSVKLGAFSTIAPSQVEPQRHAPPVDDLTISTASHNTAPALADEQIPDAPLQKAEVAPEHEALIRRIFTRDE